MDDRDDAPWAVYPERLDRPMRLGPFASGRDVVKFATGVAIGAIVGVAIDLAAGLVLAAGTVVVVLWRPDGEPLDERAVAVLQWLARRGGPAGTVTARADGARRRTAGAAALGDGRLVAVFRCGGAPLAYLPPADLALQFDRYRDLLRSVPSGLVLVATTSATHAASLVPPPGPGNGPESAAREGYRELVALLARRRPLRRVYVALYGDGGGAEALARLETSAGLLAARLAGLGVAAERLRDADLLGTLRRLGWEAAPA